VISATLSEGFSSYPVQVQVVERKMRKEKGERRKGAQYLSVGLL